MALASALMFCYGIGVMVCDLPQSNPVVSSCPTIEAWRPDDQKQVVAELRKLGRGSASSAAIGQLQRLRDQARKCRE